MDTATLLWKNVREMNLCPGMKSLDDWLNVRWGRMKIGRWQVPVLPLALPCRLGLRNALIVHDVHHVLTGYDTSYRGEAQLAAWELASGGCRTNLFFWGDRLSFVLIGLALCPRAMVSAFRRGRHARNLYGWRHGELLRMPFEDVKRLAMCAQGGGDDMPHSPTSD